MRIPFDQMWVKAVTIGTEAVSIGFHTDDKFVVVDGIPTEDFEDMEGRGYADLDVRFPS